MKRILKKILFIFLLLLVAMPSVGKKSFSNGTALKNGVVTVGNKAMNWLSTNSKKFFNFSKKYPAEAGGMSIATLAVTTIIGKYLSKWVWVMQVYYKNLNGWQPTR